LALLIGPMSTIKPWFKALMYKNYHEKLKIKTTFNVELLQDLKRFIAIIAEPFTLNFTLEESFISDFWFSEGMVSLAVWHFYTKERKKSEGGEGP